MGYLENIKEVAKDIVERHEKELINVVLRKEFGVNFISIVIDDPVTFTLDIDEVADINREILDLVNDYIPDGYYLEVTSLGVERELLNESDYEKAKGKYIYIKTYQKLEVASGEKEIYGDLIDVTPDAFIVDMKQKQRTKQIEVPKQSVAKIRLAIKF